MRRNFGKHSDVFWFLAGALFGFLLQFTIAALDAPAGSEAKR